MNSYIWTGSQLKSVRTIDGDTIEVQFDLGFKIWTTQVLRFARINCPEKRTGKPYEEAKKFTESSINNCKELKIVTYYRGKFGRYLADVFCDGINLNNLLIEKGHAVKYEETKPKKNN